MTLEQKIEAVIRETLVVTNPQSIWRAVEKIAAISTIKPATKYEQLAASDPVAKEVLNELKELNKKSEEKPTNWATAQGVLEGTLNGLEILEEINKEGLIRNIKDVLAIISQPVSGDIISILKAEKERAANDMQAYGENKMERMYLMASERHLFINGLLQKISSQPVSGASDEAIQNAHMAGQRNAGIDPSFHSALEYSRSVKITGTQPVSGGVEEIDDRPLTHCACSHKDGECWHPKCPVQYGGEKGCPLPFEELEYE